MELIQPAIAISKVPMFWITSSISPLAIFGLSKGAVMDLSCSIKIGLIQLLTNVSIPVVALLIDPLMTLLIVSAYLVTKLALHAKLTHPPNAFRVTQI